MEFVSPALRWKRLSAKDIIWAMMQEAHELLKNALALPDKEPAEFAGSLIDSLDNTVVENAEAAWQEEIVCRLEEV
jgi:hypothetical protein